jgi:hypothetical protein
VHVAAPAEELSQMRVRLACAVASEKAAVKRAEASDARLQEFVLVTPEAESEAPEPPVALCAVTAAATMTLRASADTSP